MSGIRLQIDQEMALTRGKIQLTGISSHEGQAPVARFHAWIDDRYREVEMRVGDLAVAGDMAFVLSGIGQPRSHVEIEVRPITEVQNVATLGHPFEIHIGQSIRLQTGQRLKLTALGLYGPEVLFLDSNECENFSKLDFGFWRDDGFLFEVESFDRATSTATIAVHDETAVNLPVVVGFGKSVSLRPRDVAQFPDGSSLRLRQAIRQTYDGVGWYLLASRGDDVSYPYAGSIRTSGKGNDEEHTFGLLGLGYVLKVTGMDLSDGPSLTITVDADEPSSFPLGVPFGLELQESQVGPGGILLAYQCSGHAHGEQFGEDGELQPYTEAWAAFEVIQHGVRTGFSVDLMNFDESAVATMLGFRFTVLSVGDHLATVQVDRAPESDSDLEEDDNWIDEEPAERPRFVQKLKDWLGCSKRGVSRACAGQGWRHNLR